MLHVCIPQSTTVRCLFMPRAKSLESKSSRSVTFRHFDILLSYIPVTFSDSLIFPHQNPVRITFSAIRAASCAISSPHNLISFCVSGDASVAVESGPVTAIRCVSRNSEPSRPVLLPTYTKYPLYSLPHRKAEHSVRSGGEFGPPTQLRLCIVYVKRVPPYRLTDSCDVP
jgi:hypothetical protein